MRLILLFVSLLFFWHNSIGQEYLKVKRKNLKSMFVASDSTTISEVPNTLIITNKYANDKFTAKYYFDGNQYCDSSIIQYYCSKCAQNFVDYVLENKIDKWVQTLTGTYISHERAEIVISSSSKERSSECKQMTIIQTPDKEICSTIVFKLVTIKTSEWKKIMSYK